MWRSGADRPKGRDLNLVREAKLSCQDDPAHDDDGNDDDDGDDGEKTVKTTIQSPISMKNP